MPTCGDTKQHATFKITVRLKPQLKDDLSVSNDVSVISFKQE